MTGAMQMMAGNPILIAAGTLTIALSGSNYGYNSGVQGSVSLGIDLGLLSLTSGALFYNGTNTELTLQNGGTPAWISSSGRPMMVVLNNIGAEIPYNGVGIWLLAGNPFGLGAGNVGQTWPLEIFM